jgi:hypothetical protein
LAQKGACSCDPPTGMPHGWRTTVWVLLIWTAGAAAFWVFANAALNEGVSAADVQECREEGFIPPDECESVLERLEAEEDPLIGVGVLALVWLVGAALLLLVTRPKAEAPQ